MGNPNQAGSCGITHDVGELCRCALHNWFMRASRSVSLFLSLCRATPLQEKNIIVAAKPVTVSLLRSCRGNVE